MQKLEVIEAMRDGATQEEVAQRIQISQSSISNIKKSHSSGILITMAPAAKRKQVSTHEDLDKALLVWFTARERGPFPLMGICSCLKLKSWQRYTTLTLFHHVVGYKAGENATAFLSVNSTEKPPLLTHPLHMISSVYKFLQFCLNTQFQFFYKCLPKFTFEFRKNEEAVRGIKQDKQDLLLLFVATLMGAIRSG